MCKSEYLDIFNQRDSILQFQKLYNFYRTAMGQYNPGILFILVLHGFKFNILITKYLMDSRKEVI